MNYSSHYIDQLVFQADGDHDLLTPLQFNVGLHQNSADTYVQGSAHTVFTLNSLFVNYDIVKKIEGLRSDIASAFTVAHDYSC